MKSLNEFLVLFIATILCNFINLGHSNILDKLQEDPDLSEILALVEKNPIANYTISLRSVTLFAPTNEAFQKYHGTPSASLVLYHMSTVAIAKDHLKQGSIASDRDGNPPLFITKNRNGDIFVNNARLIPSRSTAVVNNNNKKQVLHVIDEVLEPLSILPTSKLEMDNADAFQFLTHSELLNIGSHRVRSFRTQVNIMKKEYLYQSPGAHTFLIPVDEGFKTTTRSSLVDRKVIDGHVIPKIPVFTSAVALESPMTTAAFEDNIKVSVSFFQQNGKMYVKSNTIIGDSKHSAGVVLAEIVKANIPVRNGVIHLISRPLMIIDSTVTQFLQSYKLDEQENGALFKFYEVIMDMGGDVLADITRLGNVTILAPSNEAWNNANLNNIIRDRSKMRDILNMHIIKDSLDIEQIRKRNSNRITQVPTVNNKTFLYFNIFTTNDNDSITVEGGGVNATLIQTDVAQLNGFVHIIDRVLGIPYTTVLGKLESDPMLNATYTLGTLSNFNERLNSTRSRFTYFVGRDRGWELIQNEYPSTYKKLFMKDFAYHSRTFLERSLVIADRVFTMKDLAYQSQGIEDVVLPTYRDSLKFKVIEESGHFLDQYYTNNKRTGYVIKWNLKKINVFRADVECTNGIIHVLDEPLLIASDIRVGGGNGAAAYLLPSLASFSISLFMILITKILL